ncbi:response regulator [Pelagibacterium luteolum]|uniref:response regulator n=1 Tax=Pelagibacterium luteolum TaxID=440168 RepID=UPI0015A4ECE0|nr:response regulator [Pelagibacterium luteolum]
MSAGMLAGKRVLVVEDEVMIAYDVAASLTEAGALVVGPCTTVEQAYTVAQTEEIDVALLDVDVAGREVFPVAEVLDRRRIAFMFYTGRPQRERLTADFAHAPVCTKPVRLETLVEALAVLARVPA